MGWRDFQGSPPQEFMEFMESMPEPVPLITLIPLIPLTSTPEKGTVPAVPASLPKGAISNPTPSDWRPEFKAWLEGDSLRATGVCDDLAAEIILLTADDLPLQRRLLKLHCGVYQGPWWERLVERWQERAAIMEHDGGLAREQAELEAARCLRAEAFLEELKQTYLEV